MSNSFLEKVARTLRKRTKANGGICRGNDETGWQDYVEDARAVLEAMSVPSMSMVDAVHDSEDQGLHPRGSVEPRRVWNDMIEAALKESI
ncbi:hypothetical protein [Parasphingorhabdus sp.]|uniref:hypothetical protein n=1 Tax=Parasphingorhabdus sp. TaxID=2709688 RepID=UPI003A904C95